MLAQNFKTAEELKLSHKEHAALVKVLGMLERDELAHVSAPTEWKSRGDAFSGHFNMASWRRSADCGTVGCIGGTAELVGDIHWMNDTAELHELFFPHGYRIPMREITPSQAATALRSYLTTGEPRWREALS